ncbi:MAG: hypothetical protein CL910_14640 [Deltaproteobacteria bacterium]|nr:hypothetical protein [Deltaproteobacteria bacterium]
MHSTFSIDAFLYSLPIFAGEGAHPPADACDFARYCSGLDFFSMNDHAEGLNRELWQKTIESVRACNARAGDPAAPDLVAFMGFEWTQTGSRPETHFGHKNVIFPGLADEELPARPISAVPAGGQARPPGFAMRAGAALMRGVGLAPYGDLVDFVADLAESEDCPTGVPTRELPLDCRESAETPELLFQKLAEWGLPSLVIPHGLAWGIHAPPGARLDLQLSRAHHDPSRQRLIEIMSGHGNGEEFRPVPDGAASCPAPTPGHLACCWRAGELVRERCQEPGSADCEAEVERARQLALDAGVRPRSVLPRVRDEAWLDCDECRDCFKPAAALRPGQTAQYGAAIRRFDELDEAGQPLRYRFGFIASTDNHASRPATGFKQFDRRTMTDSRGPADEATERRVYDRVLGRRGEPGPVRVAPSRVRQLFDTERISSFLYPGGAVAVHATGRDRAAVWRALSEREVYGTSGPRILLWFDLLNGPEGRLPMGSQVRMGETPRFEVRAAGALRQEPGCPEAALRALGAERLERLCGGECNHPGETRHLIEAIEVVRIQPQRHAGEPVADLIADPWRRLPCSPDPAGCRVTFEDPDFARDTVYYVRVLQEATPAINGANLRTSFDAAGNASAVRPCYGGYRTPADDDCLAPVHERAWSSPIYVDAESRSP